MKVVSVKIQNILGIEEFEFNPKEINRFEGKNATGKTSTLEAVKAALKGGHDATLLRNGADEGQVVILLDDGMEIKKTITSEKTDLSVKYPRSGVKVDKPQTQLNALVDALSVNPVEFLNAPAKDRANYLLQAMPLKVTREDLAGIYDAPTPALTDILKEHAFTALAAIEKIIFDDRTGVNRLRDEKVKTAKQLGETLPIEDKDAPRPDWPQVVKDTAGQLAVSKSQLESLEEGEKAALEVRLKTIKTDSDAKFGQLADEHRRRSEELERWRKEEFDKIHNEKVKLNDEAKALHEANLSQRRPELASAISSLSIKLADAQANSKRQVQDDATRATIARVMAEAEAHEKESESLTSRLEALKGLRFRILSSLPIPGLSVKDGQVYKDGVVYDRLNTAEQIAIAIAIAKLRAKDLGIVTVDGLECLDEENFKEFERQMAGSGLQCFITRVTNPVAGGMEVITK